MVEHLFKALRRSCCEDFTVGTWEGAIVHRALGLAWCWIRVTNLIDDQFVDGVDHFGLVLDC